MSHDVHDQYEVVDGRRFQVVRLHDDGVRRERDALAARVETLTAERDEARTDSDKWWAKACEERERAIKAEARVETLENALAPFVGRASGPMWLSIGTFDSVAEVRVTRKEYEAARAALEARP